MAYISVESLTENWIKLCVAGLDSDYTANDRTVVWYLASEEWENENGYVSWSNYERAEWIPLEGGVYEGGYVNFYNLKEDMSYRILCYVYYYEMNENGAYDEKYVSLYHETSTYAYVFEPEVKSVDPSKYECRVVITGADVDYPRNDVVLKCTVWDSKAENLLEEIEINVNAGSKDVEFTILNLSPNTIYHLRPAFRYTKDDGTSVNAIYSGTNCDHKGYYEFKTELAKIPLWSWEEKVIIDPVYDGDATSMELRAAYKAVTKVRGYSVTDFSHNVWNDMVAFVRKILELSRETWTTSDDETGKAYLDRYDTLISNSDLTLTAEKFNALRYNIGSRESTGITDRESGDAVLGEYFLTLTNCINAWIMKL